MDDETYAAELLAILTNPHPTGIRPDDPYGTADDGIDRHDGFGREVWVESLTVVEGEHGVELEVAFGLAVPHGRQWRRVPRTGSLRLPFDARWRELSGYEEPATMAPLVAQETERAARRHVAHHRPTPSDPLPAPAVQWQLLMRALSIDGSPREVAHGHIELLVEQDDDAPPEVLHVLITPGQWEQLLAETGLRTADEVDELVASTVGNRDDDEHFLLIHRGRLVRSTRAELPPVRGRAMERRIAALRAEHPDAELGWYAVRPDGSISRFADFPEDDAD